MVELISCLPEETEESFINAIAGVLDIGVDDIGIYTCMLLPDTPLAEDPYYDRFKPIKRYRVLPRDFGEYLGEKVIEIETVVAGSKTITHEQYLSIRAFSFIITGFLESGTFNEIFRYCTENGHRVFDILREVHLQLQLGGHDKSSEIYRMFLAEASSELWESPESIKSYFEEDDNFSKLLNGEMGANLLHKYRAFVSIYLRDFLAFLKECLPDKGLDPVVLNDLCAFVECLRGDPFQTEKVIEQEFTFDIPNWIKGSTDINDCKCLIKLMFYHTEEQQKLIKDKLALFGYNDDARGKVLSRIPPFSLYRSYKYV